MPVRSKLANYARRKRIKPDDMLAHVIALVEQEGTLTAAAKKLGFVHPDGSPNHSALSQWLGRRGYRVEVERRSRVVPVNAKAK